MANRCILLWEDLLAPLCLLSLSGFLVQYLLHDMKSCKITMIKNIAILFDLWAENVVLIAGFILKETLVVACSVP